MKRMWNGAAAALALTFICSAPAAAYEAFKGPLGLLQNHKGKTFEGYTLVTPQAATVTYLIDMNGEIVNEWKSDYTAFYAELLPNGNLARHSVLPEAWPGFGGYSGLLEEFDWSGKKVWEHKMFIPGKEVSHHTFEVMPNGNYLMLVWEYKSYEEALAKGLDPNFGGRCIFPDGMKIGGDTVLGIWPDLIREVDRKTGETVWEWHVWDHIGKGPDKLDINVFVTPKRARGQAGPDWTHFNGVAYNPKTDQVCVTSRSLAEVYVIDKKTGNIVFRWGNPANYGAGKAPSGYYDDGDQQLFGPHAPDWTVEGNITILNNGDGRPSSNYTSGVEIDPRTGKKVWEWEARNVGAIASNFYSFNQSGVQKLPNGNYLLTATQSGHVIEVTPQKEIVWEFINPMGKDNKVYATTGQHGQTQQLWVHKCMRYGKDDPRFADKDMSVKRKLMPEGTPDWVEVLNIAPLPDTFKPGK